MISVAFSMFSTCTRRNWNWICVRKRGPLLLPWMLITFQPNPSYSIIDVQYVGCGWLYNFKKIQNIVLLAWWHKIKQHAICVHLDINFIALIRKLAYVRTIEVAPWTAFQPTSRFLFTSLDTDSGNKKFTLKVSLSERWFHDPTSTRVHNRRTAWRQNRQHSWRHQILGRYAQRSNQVKLPLWQIQNEAIQRKRQ